MTEEKYGMLNGHNLLDIFCREALNPALENPPGWVPGEYCKICNPSYKDMEDIF